ncbi:MAG: multicopper oxidase domain-containing protein, partial [Emcibacteraceae bacterium]|nr:multicopper oxidase domain-containing protein [Emcibacteraceae bacterium]
IVKPGEKLSVDITADAIGDWAFHCHLMYHMHAGMFRVVSVRETLPNEIIALEHKKQGEIS